MNTETGKVMIPSTVSLWLQDIAATHGHEAMERSIADYISAVEHYKNQLLKTKDGNIRLAMSQLGLDDLVETTLKKTKLDKRVSCKRGCSACCRMYVGITPTEAKLLLKTAKSRSISIDWDRVEKQKDRTEDEFYSSILGEDNKCVFLDNTGSCKVYRVRPLMCRSHYVATPKEMCNMKEPTKIQKFFHPEVEAFINAYNIIDGGGVGGMATQLLKYRDEIGL